MDLSVKQNIHVSRKPDQTPKFHQNISCRYCRPGILGKTSIYANNQETASRRVGIIGLDTSHATAFTRTLNDPSAGPEFGGYRVTAAYPKGSNDIKSSVDRIPGYTEDVKKLGVEIVDSIQDLLKKTDVILLETNDGRLHLEQAIQVMKAGKRVFIDKPIAASLPMQLQSSMQQTNTMYRYSHLHRSDT